MVKSKFLKVFALGVCFMLLSTCIALAEQDPDTPVSSSSDIPKLEGIRQEILDRQKEIDKYVFEQYAKEIESKGFKVTHTAPFEDYVEIGIIPYSQENAQYLYDIFGEKDIRVVEGQQAEIFVQVMDTQGVQVDAEPISTTADKQNIKSNSYNYWLIYASTIIALVCVTILIVKKLKSTKPKC